MFTDATILATFNPMIGWRQNLDPQGEKLTELITSTSGQFYNNEHSQLTIDNILSTINEDEEYVFPDFDALEASYKTGTIVYDPTGDKKYIRLLDDTIQPLTNNTYWKEYSIVTEWLKQRTDAGILATVNDWLIRKMKFNTAENLLADDRLLYLDGNFTKTIDNVSGKMVGHYFKLTLDSGVIVKKHEVALQFDTNDTITLYLFQSGIKAPIVNKAFAYTGAGGIQWHDWELSLEGGTEYMICYEQNELGATKAINGITNNSFRRNGFFEATGFSATGTISTLWDTETNVYNTSNNYGLNFRTSVECDYTKFIVRHSTKFLPAIKKRVAIAILWEFINNPNSNINKNITGMGKDQLIYQINGSSSGDKAMDKSMEKNFTDCLMSINVDRKGISKHCLPCKKRGLKYTTP